MKYEQGELNFKDVVFKWRLSHTEKDKHGEHEVFHLQIQNGDEVICQNFNNSIMENEISKKIKSSVVRSIKEIRPKMWAGYDEDLNDKPLKIGKEFTQKRIYWLLYGVINDFSNYIEIDYYSFNEFCDLFGYNNDSIESENTYKKCTSYYEDINTLNITSDQRKYFLDVVRSEEEDFNKLIKSSIKDQY